MFFVISKSKNSAVLAIYCPIGLLIQTEQRTVAMVTYVRELYILI